MNAMSTGIPTDLELRYCLFPVSTRKSGEDCHYDIINIFDNARHPKFPKEEVSDLTGTLLATWAILLRSYVGRDTVSFVFASEVNGHSQKAEREGVLHICESDVRVVYYDILNQARLRDIKVESTQTLGSEKLHISRVNSAVKLSTTFSSDSIDFSELVGPAEGTPTRGNAVDSVEQVRGLFA